MNVPRHWCKLSHSLWFVDIVTHNKSGTTGALTGAMKMHAEDLKETIRLHTLWLADAPDGRCANLRGANLRGARLYGANLQHADLRGASLYGANLHGANLQGATLRVASLRGASLQDANLQGANLMGANLQDADLRGANLMGANLQDADLFSLTGNMQELKNIQADRWPVIWWQGLPEVPAALQIGCERHAVADWLVFSDDRISQMDDNALDWWRKWKPLLISVLDLA